MGSGKHLAIVTKKLIDTHILVNILAYMLVN
jgi:hypothetical protein